MVDLDTDLTHVFLLGEGDCVSGNLARFRHITDKAGDLGADLAQMSSFYAKETAYKVLRLETWMSSF